MLGLGSGIIKVASKLENLGIVTEGLVLKHNYAVGAVQPIGSGAAYFDGNDDYIATNAKPVDTADATYCWWSNSTQANSQPIFTHGGTNIGGFHANYSSTGKPLLYLSGSIFQYWVDTNFADDGKWHHWSLVVDVSSMDDCKLYCDGIEVARSNGNTNGSITSYSNIEIGRAVNNSYLAGYICNFGVWSSHLSQPQIKSIMQKDYAGLSDSEKTDLVSWWNLDSVVEDTTTLVYDNHHGGGETLGDSVLTGDNSNFNSSIGSWVDYGGGGLEQSSGKLQVTLLSSESGVRINASSLIEGGQTGKLLKIRARIWQGTTTDTNIKIYIGAVQQSVAISSTPTYFEVILKPTSTGYLTVYRSGSGDPGTFFIDDVTVQEINGNTGTLS